MSERIRATIILKNKEQLDYIKAAVAKINKNGIEPARSFSSFVVDAAIARAKPIVENKRWPEISIPPGAN